MPARPRQIDYPPDMFLLLACTAASDPEKSDSAGDSPSDSPADSGTGTDSETPSDTAVPCDVPAGSSMTQDLTSTVIGSTVEFDLTTLDVPDLPVTTVDSSDTLLVSGVPQFISSAGVLYQDRIIGPTRMFFVHGNDDETTDRTFSLVLSGQGTAATVQILASGVGGPSDQPRYVSQVGATRYELERSAPPDPVLVAVPADGSVTLDPDLDALDTSVYQITHATYDIDTDAPVTLSLVTVATGTDPAAALPELPLFTGDPTGRRGTFTPTERQMAAPCYDPAGGSLRVRLGAHTEEDSWIFGTDAFTGDTVELVGNNGLHYDVRIPVISSDGRDVAVALVPRGGSAVGAVWVSAGIHAEQVLGYPRDVREIWPEGSGEYIGTWRHGEEIALRLLVESGTAWPIDFLLLPQDGG